MLDAARRGGYAYPAINVTSSQTLNAALQGLADAGSDGIIQVSVGGAAYFSGQRVADRVTGSLAFAAFAHEVARKYPNITVALHTDHCAKQYLGEWVEPLLDIEIDEVKLAFAAFAHEVARKYPNITVALHTDHCAKQYLGEWVEPLLDIEIDEVKHGREPMFQSHMWDGSTVPLHENIEIARRLLDKSVQAHTVLEIEIGAVGGEEDGHSAEINEKLYSTVEDGVEVANALGLGERGRYMAAFTFGKADVPVAHVGRVDRAAAREHRDRAPAARQVRAGAHRARNRYRRGGRRRGRP